MISNFQSWKCLQKPLKNVYSLSINQKSRFFSNFFCSYSTTYIRFETWKTYFKGAPLNSIQTINSLHLAWISRTWTDSFLACKAIISLASKQQLRLRCVVQHKTTNASNQNWEVRAKLGRPFNEINAYLCIPVWHKKWKEASILFVDVENGKIQVWSSVGWLYNKEDILCVYGKTFKENYFFWEIWQHFSYSHGWNERRWSKEIRSAYQKIFSWPSWVILYSINRFLYLQIKVRVNRVHSFLILLLGLFREIMK